MRTLLVCAILVAATEVVNGCEPPAPPPPAVIRVRVMEREHRKAFACSEAERLSVSRPIYLEQGGNSIGLNLSPKRLPK